ncbi:MAG: COX15/CtaA family protein, partial [Bdellovibrionales bacterium]|nr:COX15/CtaA family protein [Bdellovibrionales bacterium]
MSAKTHAEGKLFEHPNLRRFTALMPVATLFLIFAGALVTSHDAGLSVPDWPTSYGYHMFSFPVSLWIGSIFFEHGHRIIASCVGMLTVVLVFWVSLVETRRAVRILSFTALFAVCLQGVLGGMTVLLGLPASVSVGHALLAQAFLVILVVIAYSQSKEWFSRRDVKASSGEEKFFPLAMGACAVVYTQLFLGAVMRH